MEIIKDKKKLRKLIISFYLLVFLILFAVLVRGINQAAAWYNSSWLYRRPITITGNGTSYTNLDVLVSIDTAALTTTKLQANCADIRFTDSDGSTLIDYWIEGGCNTTTTQIWVRIPSMPTGDKTIYVYYGNSSAPTAEQSWTNNFIALTDDSSCASGWTRLSAMDGRFPQANSTYGGTGGNTSHNHTINSITMSSESEGSTMHQTTSGFTVAHVASVPSHTHSISDESLTSSTDHTPLYRNMLYCYKNKLDTLTNHITIFDSNIISGWTRYSELDNRYPMGASSSIGVTGGSQQHSHTLSMTMGTYSGSGQLAYIDTSGGVYDPRLIAVSHAHNTNYTLSGNNTPANRASVIFQKKSSAGTLTTERPIYMFDSSTLPPYGWTIFSTINGRVFYGSTSITPYETVHSHSGNYSTYPAGMDRGFPNTTNASFSTGEHTHTLSLDTTSTGITPPYLNVVLAQRNSSLTTSVGSEEMDNLTPTTPVDLQTEGATNPQMVSDLTPEFSAIYTDPDDFDEAIHYQIQVNTTSDFSGTEMWDSTKTSMTACNEGNGCEAIPYAGTALSFNGATYYWRIKFWDDGGLEGVWSSAANFTMQNSPTAPTNLLTEGLTNPEAVNDLTPEFSAIFNDPDTGDTATNYEIEVNTSSEFSGTVMWDSNKVSMTSCTEGTRCADISYAGTALSFDGSTYYWRIKFWDSAGAESEWSEIASFKMQTAPNSPTDPLTDGDTNPVGILTLTPTFSAIYNDPNGDDATAYEIEVNSNDTFTGTVMWDTGKTVTSITSGNRSPDYTYAGEPLTGNSGTTYYWRIRFWDSADLAGEWSTVATFEDYLNHQFFEGVQMEGVTVN